MSRPLPLRPLGLFASLALIAVAPAKAAESPAGPSQAQVKACLMQLDVGSKWKFDWQEITVGPARHPLNSYESMTLIGRPADPNFVGYPVHARYRVADTNIDAAYWFYRADDGTWQIPFLCSVK